MKPFSLLLGFLVLLSSALVGNAQDAEAPSKPLKVFILVGQSNMQGHARIPTLQHLRTREKTKQLYSMLTETDGSPAVHKNVWINSLTSGVVKEGNLTVGFGANEEKIGLNWRSGQRSRNLLATDPDH